MFLGTPAEVYLYGLEYSIQLIGVLFAFILAAVIVAPLYHPLKVTTCYEYYYIRYGTNSVRYLGVMIGTLYYTIYIAVVLKGAALALEATSGLPVWLTIIIFVSASTTYTSLGGMKAVIWTDVFQSIVMMAGVIAVFVKCLTSIGGVSNLSEVGEERLNVIDFNPDPTERHTFWTLVLGSIPQYFYTSMTQAGVQRMISTPNLRTARMMIYIAAPLYCIVWLISMFLGVAIFAYVQRNGCDPISSGDIENPNQIVPFIMMELFNKFRGVPGLFIAALTAASLSTISSALNGLAAVACIDVLKVAKPDITESTATKLSKVFVVMFGLISLTLAFILTNVEGPLGQIMAGFTGAVAGPETGIFLVSVFFRRSRPKAVIISALTVLALSLWLMLGHTFSPGVKQTPHLPLGPIDNCYIPDNITANESLVETSFVSTSQMYVNYTSTSIYSLKISNTSSPGLTDTNTSRSVLDSLYSLSYMYFHLLGTILTVVLATITSLLTQPKQHVESNDPCTISLTNVEN
ncbi:Sodium-dependent multivitamin transporter [Mactra antiquata]